jgi:hypothetical protein
LFVLFTILPCADWQESEISIAAENLPLPHHGDRKEKVPHPKLT